MAGDQVVQLRPAAAIRHLDQLDAGLPREGIAGIARRRLGGAEGELPGFARAAAISPAMSSKGSFAFAAITSGKPDSIEIGVKSFTGSKGIFGME